VQKDVIAQASQEESMPTYHGSCHCGSVAEEQFRLVRGESDLGLYQFNKKIAKHFFCRLCGIHAFRRPRSNPGGYAVNVRCLDDFDLDTASYDVNTFDGRNWEAAQEARLNAARRTP
jgi:hypothetical protein